MSHNYAGGVPYKAVTLAFWSGLIEILAGICNLGFLIQFISGPVISAFTVVVSVLVTGQTLLLLEYRNVLGHHIVLERILWYILPRPGVH